MSKDRCCVQSCLRQQGKNTYLFPFPADPIRKEIWRVKLKVKRSDVSQLVVCGQHFRSADFREGAKRRKTFSFARLNANAIPSRNLPFDRENASNESTVIGIDVDSHDGLLTPTSSTGSEEHKLYKRKRCAVPGCSNGKGNVTVTLFRVPANEPKLNLWMKILKTDLRRSSSVCRSHFNYTDIFPPASAQSRRVRLKKNARPTLNPVKKPNILLRNKPADNASTKFNENNETMQTDGVQCKSSDVVECNGETFIISFLN